MKIDTLTIATWVTLVTFLITMIVSIVRNLKKDYNLTGPIVWTVIYTSIILLPYIKDWLNWPIPDNVQHISKLVLWLIILIAGRGYDKILLLGIEAIKTIAVSIVIIESGGWSFLTSFIASLGKWLSWVKYLDRPILVYVFIAIILIVDILSNIKYKINKNKNK